MDFQQFYEDELEKSTGGYDDQIAGYKAAQTAEEQALQATKEAQEKKLADERYKAQQDAYVTRRMAEKNLPQILAAQGISGGLTETTASNVYNDYLNAQNKANAAYNTANTDVGNTYSTNLAALKTKWAQAIGEAEQNKRNDAFARAQWAYQAWQAEEERKRQAAARSSGRGGGYGGSGTTTSGGSSPNAALAAGGLGLNTLKNTNSTSSGNSPYGNIYAHHDPMGTSKNTGSTKKQKSAGDTLRFFGPLVTGLIGPLLWD